MYKLVKEENEVRRLPGATIDQFDKNLNQLLGGNRSLMWWPTRSWSTSRNGSCLIQLPTGHKGCLAHNAFLIAKEDSSWDVNFADKWGDIIFHEQNVSGDRMVALMLEFSGLESVDDKHIEDGSQVRAVLWTIGFLLFCGLCKMLGF